MDFRSENSPYRSGGGYFRAGFACITHRLSTMVPVAVVSLKMIRLQPLGITNYAHPHSGWLRGVNF
jgi:hypothetical protein